MTQKDLPGHCLRTQVMGYEPLALSGTLTIRISGAYSYEQGYCSLRYNILLLQNQLYGGQ